MTAFDPRDLRRAFGRFMTGVTVVTARAPDGTPAGFTANSFASVSLDPPLLLVCPGRFLSTFEIFRAATHFAVSVLAEGQEDISNTFASFRGDRFAQVPHAPDPHGIPVVKGAAARFSCVGRMAIDAGDHCILLGEVVDYAHRDAPGLGYCGGRYVSPGLERAVRTSPPGGAVVGAIVETGAGVLLERTPDGLRPPQVPAEGRTNRIETLATGLAARGIPVDIGPAYSAFDDRALGAHHTYVLARATGPVPAEGLHFVSHRDLPAEQYTTPAIAAMMARFALETGTRDFTLYLGDEVAGDVHRT